MESAFGIDHGEFSKATKAERKKNSQKAIVAGTAGAGVTAYGLTQQVRSGNADLKSISPTGDAANHSFKGKLKEMDARESFARYRRTPRTHPDYESLKTSTAQKLNSAADSYRKAGKHMAEADRFKAKAKRLGRHGIGGAVAGTGLLAASTVYAEKANPTKRRK